MADNKASRIFLLAALLMGVLATLVAFAWLNQAGRVDRLEKYPVMVAKYDLRPGQEVDPAKDMMVLELPKTEGITKWATRALLPEEAPGYKGQRVNRPIYGGQILMKADFTGAVADFEPKGQMRAMAIAAKGADGLGGNLVPGDYVKIMVTQAAAGKMSPVELDPTAAMAASTQKAAVTDLPPTDSRTYFVTPKPVRVLAVGRQLARSRLAASFSDMREMTNQTDAQATVTLEVTEEMAKTIKEHTATARNVTCILCPPPDAATPGR